MGGYFHGGIFREGREFSMKGAPDFPALFKKRPVFSTESKKQR